MRLMLIPEVGVVSQSCQEISGMNWRNWTDYNA
jgi:hypothetical protein